MKKFITFIASLSVLFATAVPAFAMDNLMRPAGIAERTASKEAQRSEKMQQHADKLATKLNDRAAAEIDRRVASLQKLITRLSTIKRLTADQKASFTTQIQTEITALQTLSAKIKADTDPAILKTDVQSIVKSYRVYALFIPKIEIIAAADRLGYVADQVGTLSAKLQLRIDAAKAAGNDVVTLQTLLNDMKVKAADSNTQATNAINAVLPLTPDGYPANKTTLESARAMIRVGHQDLLIILQDTEKIRKGLRSFEKSKTGTPSATVTP